MRVVLVGRVSGRARLRAQLAGLEVDIAAEFATLEEARASGLQVDGILLVQDNGVRPAAVSNRATDHEAIDEPLTPREIEVLEQLAEGLPNKAIARRLGISDQTVKFHVASIAAKLGALNRTDAVRRAVRRGLLSL